jgi:hypothetical protein
MLTRKEYKERTCTIELIDAYLKEEERKGSCRIDAEREADQYFDSWMIY